ncbi:MAG: sugar phosphate isomerase/epimerase family protein [Akkermansiaceae bacterium]|nr:sugar phosphate isomerase/epimerase family protein [Akkermansiaceae bacterium]
MEINRRKFMLKGSQVLLAASAMPSLSWAQKAASPRFQIALSQYSLRALLKDGSLTALDFPQFTLDTFGIKTVDLWEGGLPKDKLDDKAYLTQLREQAAKAGTDIYLLMTGALFSHPKKVDQSLKQIIPSIDRAATLGCKYLRVFLSAQDMESSVEAMKRLADEAAKKEITIVIEPGSSKLSSKGKFLAELAEKVNHPHCKLMPDFGKLKNKVYEGTQAMLPHAASVSAKMHSFDDKGLQPDFDYVRLTKMIAESDFKGVIAIEWEGNNLKPVAGVKASQKILAESFKQNGITI